jgi:hypothetical protein
MNYSIHHHHPPIDRYNHQLDADDDDGYCCPGSTPLARRYGWLIGRRRGWPGDEGEPSRRSNSANHINSTSNTAMGGRRTRLLGFL